MCGGPGGSKGEPRQVAARPVGPCAAALWSLVTFIYVHCKHSVSSCVNKSAQSVTVHNKHRYPNYLQAPLSMYNKHHTPYPLTAAP
jgi:hypothetical protein